MLPDCFHGSIFPQIYPVVKPVLGDLHGVCFVGLDLADGTTTAALYEQRIQNGDIDPVLMQSCCHRLMVAPGSFHDYPRILS